MGGMCSSEDAPPVMAAVISNDAESLEKELAKPGVDINEKDEVPNDRQRMRAAAHWRVTTLVGCAGPVDCSASSLRVPRSLYGA